MQVAFKVNGRPVTVDAPPNTFLVHAIREHFTSPAPTSAATPPSAAPARST
ncbi:hypothetical protein GmRootV77_09200 [Variovorax sp. V77]